ncbi:hypothetical protein DFP72DRAFT_1062443 [Ephemerocybe angulata]|uniref:Uncharacterized protein n=1 Tax=Ephemerocybe angulata TaxID=980116 RepID=A0A8H6IA52_9AGAR|nr:hypothetical protein DFP72DRAFT_1062443 [Tulosesus angulatus]
MKLTLAPLLSLLVGASYLVASAAAYSYNDYNELNARYQIDDVLSERGFGLEARETVDVPFQPSLRAFLEEAITAHRRSMGDYEEALEARVSIDVLIGKKFRFLYANIMPSAQGKQAGPGKTAKLENVDTNMKLSAFKELVKNHPDAKGFDPNAYQARLGGNLPANKLDDAKTLMDNKVEDGFTIIFKPMIEVNVKVFTPQGEKTAKMKVPTDTRLPALKKDISYAVGGFFLDNYEARVGSIPLKTRKTLSENNVKNGSQIDFYPPKV